MSATLEEFATEGDQDDATVVVAECHGCGSVHPLGSREADDDTAASTVCPECGSPQYSTTVRERGGERGA
jgi:rRNA maturation endonuclease Nob1